MNSLAPGLNNDTTARPKDARLNKEVLMYAAGDPRAALATPTEQKVNAPTEFSAAEYAKFYESEPQEDDANSRSWYVRGQNVVLCYSETKPGGTFARAEHPDEYAVLLPDKDVSIEISAAGKTAKNSGPLHCIRTAWREPDSGTVRWTHRAPVQL